jgi:hypothetical protein
MASMQIKAGPRHERRKTQRQFNATVVEETTIGGRRKR